jgi:apolipoprotein N-acyltransferase
MSLTAVLVAKVLYDLPRRHKRAAFSLLPFALFGYASVSPVYEASPWMGVLLLVAATLFATGVIVAVMTGIGQSLRTYNTLS